MMITDAEIRARAVKFSREWKDAKDEKKEMQAFWIDLFGIFNVPKRKVATYFERRVGRGGADLQICFGKKCCWSSKKAVVKI